LFVFVLEFVNVEEIDERERQRMAMPPGPVQTLRPVQPKKLGRWRKNLAATNTLEVRTFLYSAAYHITVFVLIVHNVQTLVNKTASKTSPYSTLKEYR
jgi:hypothetical protein